MKEVSMVSEQKVAVITASPSRLMNTGPNAHRMMSLFTLIGTNPHCCGAAPRRAFAYRLIF
jgi:hypothetical protein